MEAAGTGRGPSTKPVSLRLRGAQKSLLEIARQRLVLGAAILSIAFVGLSLRLTEVALLGEMVPRKVASISAEGYGAPVRASILDRNGVLLATSLPTQSLNADPQHVREPVVLARRLSEILDGGDPRVLQHKLQAKSRFVWLKRHLTPWEQTQVNLLGAPGLQFSVEHRRVYTHGSLVAHVLGYAKDEHRGLAGIENAFDEDLLENPGRPLALSIDVRFQHVMHEELKRAVLEQKAVGAAGIILDIKTGGLRAVVSLPDFDPNNEIELIANADAIFNRASLGRYEMGSTFKAFTIAMALDSGLVDLRDEFDATKPLRLGKTIIRDFHAKSRWLSVPEIFVYSSNIGVARMALKMGGERQKEFLRNMGLLDKMSFDLPEISSPGYPQVWREINTATISYGHGISVSPIHLAAGLAALVNGGVWSPPTLIRDKEGLVKGRRVITETTSRTMRQLFRLAVTHGTGARGGVDGYLVGGKTGTANKVSKDRKGYDSTRVLSSFAGMFPMSEPQYLVLVLLDEPKGRSVGVGQNTGGWVAAPVVANVIRRIGPVNGIAPMMDPTVGESIAGTFVELDGNEIRLAAY
ncbi:MAG: penicillin-binding protein [Rhodospirillaceae bacterium]|nr:penicillin-binding protein [Rhodospirillaceae bacterium]